MPGIFRRIFFVIFILNAASLFWVFTVSAADYVIAISVDGLRPATIRQLGAEELPHFYRFRTEGIWTDQARTDYDFTFTNPNHVTMVTGRPVLGTNGHNYSSNGGFSPDTTLHSVRGAYVSSMFDVAHDHGFSTSFYSGKDKLGVIDQSYAEETGGEDLTGEDNGRDKIDHFEVTTTLMSDVLTDLFVQQMRETPFGLSFIHLIDPDSAGHGDRWETDVYFDAVRRVDGYLGQIFELVAEAPFAGNTTLVLTSDHGGFGSVHQDPAHAENYTVPFYVWGADVPVPGDLYAANVDTRLDPGDGRPNYHEPVQPIRNGDLANLSLSLLGLPAIPDEEAVINQNQDLRVSGPSRAPRWPEVSIRAGGEGLELSWESAGDEFLYQVEQSASLDSDSWEPVDSPGGGPIAELNYSLPEATGDQFFRVRLVSDEN